MKKITIEYLVEILQDKTGNLGINKKSGVSVERLAIILRELFSNQEKEQ